MWQESLNGWLPNWWGRGKSSWSIFECWLYSCRCCSVWEILNFTCPICAFIWRVIVPVRHQRTKNMYLFSVKCLTVYLIGWRSVIQPITIVRMCDCSLDILWMKHAIFCHLNLISITISMKLFSATIQPDVSHSIKISCERKCETACCCYCWTALLINSWHFSWRLIQHSVWFVGFRSNRIEWCWEIRCKNSGMVISNWSAPCFHCIILFRPWFILFFCCWIIIIMI